MHPEHNVRLHRTGLNDFSRELNGDELIHAGLRPLDYHPGNAIALAVYPHLLARAVAAQGRVPRFDYLITLNDLEPTAYDLEKFRPTGTSIGLMGDPDRAVTRATSDLRHLLEEFPEIRLRFKRTSEMVDTDEFRRIVKMLTREKAHYLRQFMEDEHIDEDTLNAVHFMGLACSQCREPIDLTSEVEPSTCPSCGASLDGQRHYWMHFIPLIAMKWRLVQPDLLLIGSDYIEPNRGLMPGVKHENSLEAVLAFYGFLGGGRPLNILMPPLLLGPDGQKMSKSIGNIQQVSYEALLDACGRCAGGELTLDAVAER